MTGYTVNTGSNQKFSMGWDQVFNRSANRKKGAEGTTTGAAGKKAAKKVAADNRSASMQRTSVGAPVPTKGRATKRG